MPELSQRWSNAVCGSCTRPLCTSVGRRLQFGIRENRWIATPLPQIPHSDSRHFHYNFLLELLLYEYFRHTNWSMPPFFRAPDHCPDGIQNELFLHSAGSFSRWLLSQEEYLRMQGSTNLTVCTRPAPMTIAQRGNPVFSLFADSLIRSEILPMIFLALSFASLNSPPPKR